MVTFHESPCKNTYKVVQKFQFGTARPFGFSTSWGWNPTFAAPTVGNCQGLATTVQTLWDANCAALMSTQFTMVSITVTDLDTASGATYQLLITDVGTRAGVALSPAACAMCNYAVPTRYRGGKGKTFLPFGTQVDATPQLQWTTGSLTAFNTGWRAFLGGIRTNGSINTVTQVIRSYFKGPQPNPDPGVWDPRNVPMPRVAADGMTPAPITYPVTSSAINPQVRFLEERNPGV